MVDLNPVNIAKNAADKVGDGAGFIKDKGGDGFGFIEDRGNDAIDKIGDAAGSAPNVFGEAFDFFKKNPLFFTPAGPLQYLNEKASRKLADIIPEEFGIIDDAVEGFADANSYLLKLENTFLRSVGNVAVDGSVNGIADIVNLPLNALTGQQLPELDLFEKPDLSNASLPEKAVSVVGQGVGFVVPFTGAARGVSLAGRSISLLSREGAFASAVSRFALPAGIAGFLSSDAESTQDRLIHGAAAALSFGLTNRFALGAVLPDEIAARSVGLIDGLKGKFFLRPSIINNIRERVSGNAMKNMPEMPDMLDIPPITAW